MDDYTLEKLAGIRKKGAVSTLYMEGKIKDEVLVLYVNAFERYKEETGKNQDDWLKLPKSCSMYSHDRRQCKKYWLKI